MHKFLHRRAIVDFCVEEIEWGVHGSFPGWHEVSWNRRQSRAVADSPVLSCFLSRFPRCWSNFIKLYLLSDLLPVCFSEVGFAYHKLQPFHDWDIWPWSSGSYSLDAILYSYSYTPIRNIGHSSYTIFKMKGRITLSRSRYQKKLLDDCMVTCTEFLHLINHDFQLHDIIFEGHVRASNSACLVTMNGSKSQLLHVSQDVNRR